MSEWISVKKSLPPFGIYVEGVYKNAIATKSGTLVTEIPAGGRTVELRYNTSSTAPIASRYITVVRGETKSVIFI